MSAPATLVICTPPVGADPRDVRTAIAANVPSSPDGVFFVPDGTVQVAYITTVLSAQQISTLQTAVAAAAPDPNSAWNVQATLLSKAQTALNTNATFQALPSPTQAQTLAQVQALTKECNAVIRLLIGQLDTTAGT